MGSFAIPVGRRRAVAACVVGLLVLALVLRHAFAGAHGGGADAALQVAPLAGTAAARGGGTAGSARGRLVVDVVGAVRRPGVYRLRAGARVQDAVVRAGRPARAAAGRRSRC